MGSLALGELKACMHDLGLDISRASRYFRRANIVNNVTGDRSPVRVVFNSYGNDVDSPHLVLDKTVCRVGINDHRFEPSVLEMAYDERQNALRIIGKDYDFTLKF